MQTARRVYLYAMSGVTLGVVGWGVFLLVRLALRQAGLEPTDYGFDPGYAPDVRGDLSLALAMLAVGLPVWGAHWRIVSRSTSAGAMTGEAERASAVRAAYLAIVLAVSLPIAATAGVDVLRWVGNGLLGGGQWFGDAAGSLGALLAAGAIWLFHARLLRDDRRAVAMAGPAAWIPRLYVHGAALIGFVASVVAVVRLLDIVVGLAMGTDTGDVRLVVADFGGDFVVWSVIWFVHLRWSSTAVDPDGVPERDSRMRLVYFTIAIGVSVAAAVFQLVDAASPYLRRALDAPDPYGYIDGDGSLGRMALSSLLGAIVWALAWWGHTRWLRREASLRGDAGRAQGERLIRHAVAAVALGFGATGIGWLVGLGIDLVLGGQRASESAWRGEAAGWIPIAAVGLALWAWTWRGLLARHRADPVGDASATIRRAYLLLAVAIALVAALAGATLVVYRVVGRLIGAPIEGDLISSLSTPVGALVIALAVGGYHLLAVRADDALRAAHAVPPLPAPPLPVAAAPAPGARPAPEAAPATRELVLTGTPGEDLTAVVEGLRAALPPGHTLESR